MAKTHKVSADGVKPKNAQTRPEYTGEQNMKEIKKARKYKELSNGDIYKLGQLEAINDIKNRRSECMKANRVQRGSAWTEETLRKATDEFFDWCLEEGILPSKSLMCIWFNCSTATMFKWSKSDDFFGEIIGEAFLIMETIYFNDLDQRPATNMFRLKTNGFGYVEETKKQEIEITKSNEISAEELERTIDNIIV